MRAGILARVSTEGQAGAEHHSLPVQLEQMRRLAERRRRLTNAYVAGWRFCGIAKNGQHILEALP